MRLRYFEQDTDFGALAGWVNDERIHALWCAGRMRYPLEKDDLIRLLEDHREKYGDRAYTAVGEDDKPVGFFCLAAETDPAMLRFIVVDPAKRGKGLGREMIRLAAEQAFGTGRVKAVQLAVFAENAAARRCYLAAGFEEVSLTEKAFRFKNEEWGRLMMIKNKTDDQ